MTALDTDGIPVLKALRVGDLWHVACPYCKDRRGRPLIHTHGGSPGHRAADCATASDSPLRRRGYIFEPAGGAAEHGAR